MIPRHIRLLLALLFLPALSYGQSTVTGHVRVPDPTVAAVNAKVCVTLINFKPNVARVIGTGQIINTTNYCVTPAADGSYSFSIYGNNVISPTTTNWRVDWLFNGIQTSSATYLINHSPFNLDTETPLSSSTPAGPNQLLLNVFPFTQLTPSLTWTIPHNFNDSNTIAIVSGLDGNDIYPDSKNCRNDANNCIVTFITPTSGFAIAMHAAAINIASNQPNAIVANPTGAQSTNGQPLSIGGPFTVTNLNGEIWLSSGGSIASAIASLPSGGTLHLPAGTYPVSATLGMVSNLDIECAPNNATILQAGPALNAPMISASGINHFRIAGCVVDGNRAGNANQFNLLTVASSSNGEISGNHFQNNQGRGIQLTAGNSHIRITGNEVNNYGQPLPASLGNEGIVLQPAAGGVGNSHIEISSNRVHDGNVGITVYSSANVANVTSDIDITHNRCYANANDCILVFSLGAGAVMQGIRVLDNEAYCNGWPANGTGFSANCTAGLLQTGVTASSSGVGIDFNSPLLDQPIVIGNRAHDNFFEGIDAVAQTVTTVNTSGTTVTWVNGDNFNTAWRANQGMRINGVNYLIASVAGAQTTLTLSTSAGVQTGVGFTGIGYMRGTFVGNIAYNNGRGNSGSSGSGFSDSAYGNSWSGNISYNNQAYGFIDQFSSFVTHTGDKAYNNGLRIGTQPGFLAQGALNPSYLGVSTDDTQAVPTQTIGINFDGQTNNAYADSSSIVATNAVVDSAPASAGNSWRIGKFLSGQPPCLTTVGAGGSYCITGSAAGGAFLATLPAVNGTLSPLIAQDCGTTTTCSTTDVSSTAKVITGSVQLNGASPGTATVAGFNPAFTSTSSYKCSLGNGTTAANGKKVVRVSVSSITITGVNGDSDTVDYVCVGN